SKRKRATSKGGSKFDSKKLRSRNTSKEKGKPRKQRGIGRKRLERALRGVSGGMTLAEAAREIRVSPDKLKKAALEKKLIRKRGGRWIVAARLPRRMILFSDGRVLIVTTKSKRSASLIGRYMSAVRQFLRTNKPEYLKEFSGAHIKDTAAKIHPF